MSGSQWDEITSFANLCAAARRAALGKRGVRGAARFLERLEPEALALQRELLGWSWRPSVPTTFVIHDPKTREITAAPFRDRVVHHALIDPLEALFDAALVPQTFACRRGKGMHRALGHARALVRSHSHFLKLDVEACFASIEHEIVLKTLRELDLEQEVLRLSARILGGAGGRLGIGLPIGNLTSQWFANLVLGRLDRFVLALPGIRGYARYMDDCVLFADDKQVLRDAHGFVEGFLEQELHLRLKSRATILAPVSQGLPFLGWRVYRGTTRLRPENVRRTRRRLAHRAWELRAGRSGAERYLACARSIVAHLEHGDTRELRRSLLAASFVQEHELGSGSQAPPTA